MKRRRRIALRAVAALLSVLAALAIAELYARSFLTAVIATEGGNVSMSDKDGRLRPGLDVIVANNPTSKRPKVRFKTNALGMRSDEIGPKAPDETRVLVLGDSITLAYYVELEESYVGRCEARLRAALPGRKVRAIDGGFGDSGTQEQMDFLEEKGPLVAPDVVVLGFYLNDSRPPQGFSKEVGHPGWLRTHSVLADRLWRDFAMRRWVEVSGEPRFAHLPVIEKTRDAWTRDRATFLRLCDLAKYDWGAAWQEDSWAAIDAQLARFEALAKTRGFKVVVLILPVIYQVDLEFVEDAPQRKMLELCAKRGLPALDVLPLLRAHRDERPLAYDQCHLTPRANALVGEALADFLIARGLVATPAPR